ncbi:MAG TPA: helix-turn-helix transcriptional regulator [Anaeromyxobacter sp.]|nr:helix-turn-helix transcriptional regulator [Anaeromyxobacter sp.]
MRRRGPLVQTLEDLREGCSAAADSATIADLVSKAAERRIGISGLSFFRISGPVAAPGDFVTVSGRVSAARAAEASAELMRLVDREILPFTEFFASSPRSFDIAARWSAEFLRSTQTWAEYWHPWGVERQLVGVLGSAAAPRGFVCVARQSSEMPFTADDLRTFEAIRCDVEGAVADQHAPSRGMEDALAALSGAGEECLLFDGSGTLLWLTEAACERLALAAARLGSSFAIARSPALEELRVWVRARAREADAPELAPTPPPARLSAPGARLAIRRYDDRGRTRFLVTLHAEVAGSAALSSARARAEDLARARGLTPRQTDVLAQLATGQGNRAISAGLGCSEKTVELHVSALFSKLGCRSRAELVARFWTH